MKRFNPFPQGMTLVEVLIAGTMGGLVLLSLAATTGNIFDAYGTGKGQITASRDLASCLDRIMSAVREADTATQPRTHALMLVDPAGEQTLIEWSGISGDPLTWKINSDPALDLLADVEDYSFTIQSENVEREATTSTSGQLIYFDHYSEEEWSAVELDSGDLIGIEFSLPMDVPAETIQLETVGLRLGRKISQTADLRIWLYESIANEVPRPFGSGMARIDIGNADIPWAESAGYGNYYLYWETYSLGEQFWILPNRRYILMLEGKGPAASCFVRVRVWDGGGDGPDNGIYYLRSTNGGASWYPNIGDSLITKRDVPIDLSGTTYSLADQTVSLAESVTIALTLKRESETLTLTRTEYLRGGAQ
ncbi:MAG: hypothetical protein KJ645_04720 [Planctomycetes bacterium]|nr:hypothetical protein [Planctomycetota bacterium]